MGRWTSIQWGFECALAEQGVDRTGTAGPLLTACARTACSQLKGCEKHYGKDHGETKTNPNPNPNS